MSFNPLAPEPGIYDGVPIDVYHSSPGVSRSSLMRLEGGTPKDLRHYLDHGIDETPAMALGSAVDCMVFEPHLFNDTFAVKPSFGRSKSDLSAKAEWEARNSGKTLLTEAAFEEAQMLANACKNAKSVRGLMEDAKPQQSMWFNFEGQLAKCRPDGVDFNRHVTFDLKTVYSLEDRVLQTRIVDGGYDVQAAINAQAMMSLGLEWRAHVIVWVRKSEPIDVRCTVIEATDDWLLYGECRFRRLMRRYREAMASQTWEGWDTGVSKLEVPKWVSIKLAQEEELERAQEREGDAA